MMHVVSIFFVELFILQRVHSQCPQPTSYPPSSNFNYPKPSYPYPPPCPSNLPSPPPPTPYNPLPTPTCPQSVPAPPPYRPLSSPVHPPPIPPPVIMPPPAYPQPMPPPPPYKPLPPPACPQSIPVPPPYRPPSPVRPPPIPTPVLMPPPAYLQPTPLPRPPVCSQSIPPPTIYKPLPLPTGPQLALPPTTFKPIPPPSVPQSIPQRPKPIPPPTLFDSMPNYPLPDAILNSPAQCLHIASPTDVPSQPSNPGPVPPESMALPPIIIPPPPPPPLISTVPPQQNLPPYSLQVPYPALPLQPPLATYIPQKSCQQLPPVTYPNYPAPIPRSPIYPTPYPEPAPVVLRRTYEEPLVPGTRPLGSTTCSLPSSGANYGYAYFLPSVPANPKITVLPTNFNITVLSEPTLLTKTLETPGDSRIELPPPVYNCPFCTGFINQPEEIDWLPPPPTSSPILPGTTEEVLPLTVLPDDQFNILPLPECKCKRKTRLFEPFSFSKSSSSSVTKCVGSKPPPKTLPKKEAPPATPTTKNRRYDQDLLDRFLSCI